MGAFLKFAGLFMAVTTASTAVTYFVAPTVASGNGTTSSASVDDTPQGKFMTNLLALGNVTAEIDLEVTYQDIELELSGDVNLYMPSLEKIDVSFDGDISFNNYKIDFSFAYFNSNIYATIFDTNVMLEGTDLSGLFEVFSAFDIDIELPNELQGIDAQSLMNSLSNMTYTELNTSYKFDVNLADLLPISFFSDFNYKLSGIEIDAQDIFGASIECSINASSVDSETSIVKDPSQNGIEYTNLKNYTNMLKDIAEMLSKDTLAVSLNASVTKNNENVLNLDSTIGIDLPNNDYYIDASINTGVLYDVFGRYVDDNVFFEINDILKGKYPASSFNDLMTFFEEKAGKETSTTLSFLDPLFNSDLIMAIEDKDLSIIEDLFTKFEIKEDTITIELNASTIGFTAGVITIVLQRDYSDIVLAVNGIVFEGYSINLMLITSEYQNISDFDPNSYPSMEGINDVVMDVFDLINTDEFAFDIELSMLDSMNQGFTMNGFTQFDLSEKNGSANLVFNETHNGAIHDLKVDIYGEDKMYFKYNEGLKAKFDMSTIDGIMELMDSLLSGENARFMQYFGTMFEQLETSFIGNIMNGDVGAVLSTEIFKSIKMIDGNLEVVIYGDVLMMENDITLKVIMNDGSLSALSLEGIKVGDDELKFKIIQSTYNPNYERLPIDDSYTDFTDVFVILDLFANSVNYGYYRVQGSDNDPSQNDFDLFLDVIGISLDYGAHFDMQIYDEIDQNGNHLGVRGYLKLEGIKAILAVNGEGKDIDIEFYYYDSENIFMSVHRNFLISSRNYTKTVRFTLDQLMTGNNLLYYFVEYGIGIYGLALNAIKDAIVVPPADRVLDYSTLLQNYVYSNGSRESWTFDINMGELTYNEDIKNLHVQIFADEYNRLDELYANLHIDVDGVLTVDLALGIQVTEYADSYYGSTQMGHYYDFINSNQHLPYDTGDKWPM